MKDLEKGLKDYEERINEAMTLLVQSINPKLDYRNRALYKGQISVVNDCLQEGLKDIKKIVDNYKLEG